MHQTSSWNAALILAARAICTPLAAGCMVVVTASELSPKSHHLLVQALFDADLPNTAINFVLGRERGRARRDRGVDIPQGHQESRVHRLGGGREDYRLAFWEVSQ